MDCWTQEAIADLVKVEQKTISNWVSNFRNNTDFTNPPASRQHFDMAEVAERYGYTQQRVQQLKTEVLQIIAELAKSCIESNQVERENVVKCRECLRFFRSENESQYSRRV